MIDVRSGGANGTIVAALTAETIASGQLQAVSDGKGGTLVDYVGAEPTLAYGIDTADRALQSNVVRATMSSDDGSPIDGAGVKIGIISDSFDATGTADAAAAAGYLPYDPQTGTAAVTVLGDDPKGADEGQAMAELVHQIAPGAQIFFDAGGNTPGSMAAAVTALQQAGCTIITDDLGFANEPTFQVTGKLDRSIQNAIDGGVSYFTAASNEGNAYFQGAFDPVQTSLHDQPTEVVAANQFDNGTAYQTITVTGGENLAIDLQWDAPFPRNRQGVADSLVAKLYDTRGNLVATSHQLELDGSTIPEVEIDIETPSADFTNYQLALYQPDGTPAVGQFIYTLNGFVDGGSQLGGFVDDPNAEIGAGTTYGHDLVPGANTVGAVDWSNAPAFGTPYFAEGFSSGGPGELLFAANGDRLATPLSDGKVNFLAPDGTDVSTPGFQPFFGTSAAAPDAAAVAALMMQANPDLTPRQVTNLLEASAVDLGLSSAEQGSGLIQAPEAVAGAKNLASPTLTLSDPTVEVASGRKSTKLAISGTSNAIGQTVAFELNHHARAATTTVAADGSWSIDLYVPSSRSIDDLSASVQGTGTSSATASAVIDTPKHVVDPEGATTFIFRPLLNQNDIVDHFRASGRRHDTIELPQSNFVDLASVIGHASSHAGNTTITDPSSGSTIELVDTTKAELFKNRKDIMFY